MNTTASTAISPAQAGRNRFVLSRWVFLRCLGIVFFLALIGYWRQFPGLIGENGIQPAGMLLDAVAERHGAARFAVLPTLCWLSASDTFIQCLCALGVVAAALLIAGFAPLVMLPVLWVIYLSLVAVGGVFYGFQWDVLLLETALVAIAFAPAQWYERLTTARPPGALARWLLYLLLVKLMVLSGLTKLASGDDAWRALAALDYHYFTQPLPTPMSWYLHHLPPWFARVSVVVMFAIELGAPILICCGRRARHVAAALLIALQVLIALGGNYGYFNLLTIVLCLPLLDDAFLRALVPQRWRGRVPRGLSLVPESRGRRIAVRVFACVVLTLSLMVSVREVTRTAMFDGVLRHTQGFRSVNGYGLFRVMTTQRPEIIIEGSEDGQHWYAYEFASKPGDVTRPPPWVAPYQPRLDWQMWFAALGSLENNRWFGGLLYRLALNQPEVIALLEHNPFAGRPPRYLRATVWEYRFTTQAERRETGAWWMRTRIGSYTPVIDVQQALQR